MNRRLCIAVTSPQTVYAFLGRYLEHLVCDGWEVFLVTAPDENLYEFARTRGVKLRTISITRDPNVRSDIRALVGMLRVLREVRPAVFVYATPKAGLLGAIAAWVARTPRRIYEQWGLRLEGQHGVTKGLLYVTEWIACRLSTEVVANSRSLAEILRRKKLVGASGAVVLGEGSSHGVDVERFRPDSLEGELDNETRRFIERASEAFVIGYVGRVHKDKGIDAVLKAIQLANDQGSVVRAVIVGPVDELGGDIIVRDGKSLAESGIVHFVGPVSDTRPYYRAMDSLVLMSLREGFPNVVLEAGAMGVPAVVSDATGAVDSVIDGRTGVVVPVGDYVKLSRVFVTMCDDREGVRAMGKRARQFVVENFESNNVMAMHSHRFAG